MNLLTLSWKYLSFRPLATGLNVILLAFGLAIITVLLLVQHQFEQKMTRDSVGIDLVVGAKGSPLQLILSSVYHIDFPTGNIKIEEAQRISKSRLVKQVIPLAMGDNVQGLRILGTNHDYLDLYGVKFAAGKAWEKPFEVTLGAESAQILGLKLGDTFSGSHGISVGSHDHDQHAFHVTGILAPSGKVVDRLVLTSIESVWYTHDEGGEAELETTTEGEKGSIAEKEKPFDEGVDPHFLPVAARGFPTSDQEREVTTLLVRYRNPMAAIQLPRMINSGTSMQAASPAFEMSRLFELLGLGISLLKGLALALVVIAGLSIFIALYNSLKERKYDLAILRTLGASRGQLVTLVFLEGISLTILGAIFGIAFGHGFLALIVEFASQEVVSLVDPWIFLPEEGLIFGYALAVGIIASLIPAWSAYQTSIAKQLTKT
uniref:ABC transporter permease n=1 Tax=Algoriphagus sp. TaxID=1872435 RepID=UPI00404830B5